jgi:2-dehydropantoate 2-reductase
MFNHPWHIIGAGSIVCLWTAQFLKQGLAPEFVLRESRYNAQDSSQQKLTITNLDGTEETYPVKTTTAKRVESSIQHLLVCTKAQDALSAIQSIAHKMADNGQIVLMQNGMGSQQDIVRKFPALNIWAATTTEGAWMKDGFHVCHAGSGKTWVGPLSHSCNRQPIESLFQLPPSIHFADQIEHKLWEKLAINCAINGLTALYDCRNGELLENQHRKHRLTAIANEVAAVRKAAGIPEERSLTESAYEVCKGTANNHSSTCMDARHGRKTELPYINGYLIQKAQELEIPVPENRKLLTDLKDMGIE